MAYKIDFGEKLFSSLKLTVLLAFKEPGNQTYIIKKIMRNPLFLGQKSEDATEKDK